jgi:isocitrate dehydrogenase kinase/phosphatase
LHPLSNKAIPGNENALQLPIIETGYIQYCQDEVCSFIPNMVVIHYLLNRFQGARMAAHGGENELSRNAAMWIKKCFCAYRDQFDAITVRARARFCERNWQAMHADAVERLSLYPQRIDQAVDGIQGLLGERLSDRGLWEKMKTAFSRETGLWFDRELAETWFNSVTRRIFSTVGVDSRIEFTVSSKALSLPEEGVDVYRVYNQQSETKVLFETVLTDYHNQLPFADIPRDARLISERVDAYLMQMGSFRRIEKVEIGAAIFYRGMSAYLVGKVFSGAHILPLVIALLHGPAGIFSDAVLLSEKDVSVLFSFTRSSFHVETGCPVALVRFLKSMLPKKKIAELYMATGYGKHGKTELYRDLQQHLTTCSGEQFEMAPGQRGMVMEVFGVPGYDIVFKLIKDRFAYPKKSTRREVMEKYDLVFTHERAGRLVEAQSFEHLAFDRCAFSEPFLSQLRQTVAGTVHVDADRITLDHAYVERRVMPLDLFLKQADAPAAHAAVIDFGNAIKELAKSNIFPGDFLLKNFGLTRHGRVVFYDYDELCLLTECRFRKIPPPRTDADAFSGEPWYYVGENDVFPEEFKTFMGLNKFQMEIFLSAHADLFGVDFWRRTQETILSGRWCHIFPYPADRRFDQPRDAVCELWDVGCRG